LVGAIFFSFLNSTAYIARMAVLPEFQGQKIGLSLLQKTLILLKEKNCNYVSLSCLEDISNFYEKIGFEEKGKRRERNSKTDQVEVYNIMGVNL
jgi:ribosomal protein S18 acetylase RimI-like enzyme